MGGYLFLRLEFILRLGRLRTNKSLPSFVFKLKAYKTLIANSARL